MKERPILFSGEMVRAILAGTKTMTRRICKRQPQSDLGASDMSKRGSPYGVPGDRLWVRETWALWDVGETEPRTIFRVDEDKSRTPRRWKPAIHMPRALSRIDLEVTAVRVERLQDIAEEDARAEGMDPHYPPTVTEPHATLFQITWDSINGKRAPWSSNPWVWCVSFKRVRP